MRTLLLAFTAMLLTGTLEAQNGGRPNTREGFWISFGAGAGSAGADCTTCNTDRTLGAAGFIRLGGSVSRKILLGGESEGWTHSESGVDEVLGTASFVLFWYPSATGAFFFKVGIGGTTYRADNGTIELTATAPSAALGLGYDIRVSRNLSITPFLNTMATSSVNVKVNGVTVPTDDISLNQVALGVALTVH